MLKNKVMKGRQMDVGNDNRKLTTCANPKLTTLNSGYNYG
jgi:hypothetical protein